MTNRYLLIANFTDNQARFAAQAVFGKFNPVQVEENIIVLRAPGDTADMAKALAEATSAKWFTTYALVEMPSSDVVRAYSGDGSYSAAFGSANWK